MSVREIAVSVENGRGDSVDCDIRFVEEEGPKPVVVFCHGFKGFKDWGPYPEWGRKLARSGFVSVHMNFSYNGVSRENPTEFTELEKFANNTCTRELDDLGSVLDAIENGGISDAPVDPTRLGLVGHSRGGGTVILQTARDARVGALATWSSVSTLVDRFSEKQIADWERRGYTEVVNSRTGQIMRLNRVLYDDARANRDKLDVRSAATQIDVPWLVVHARDDEAVGFHAAETLVGKTETAELFVAEGGHTFGGAHPFDGPVRPPLETVWTQTSQFFSQHLGRG